MGNQTSSETGDVTSTTVRLPNIKHFLRQSGALGLSKSELDERCKPSGLYNACQWEERAVRKLVGDGKLAARLTGTEHRESSSDQECPICFLHYSEVNVSKCCNAYICTECYLQVRPQKEKAIMGGSSSNKTTTCCPFCNHHKLTVLAAKRMDQHAINERDAEEQTFIEAKLRDRCSSNDHDHYSTSTATPPCTPTPSSSSMSTSMSMDNSSNSMHNTATASSSHTTPTAQEQAPAYGSYLAQNERVSILRARSESIESKGSLPGGHGHGHGHGHGGGSGHGGDTNHTEPDISSMAMTPEERQLLEAEMRAQHSHPLSMRLEAEESERRLNNEREYYRAQTGRLRELRARRELLHNSMVGGGSGGSGNSGNNGRDGSITLTLPPTSPASRRRYRASREATDVPGQPRMGRDWNRIVDAFESSGNGSIQSLDDLVVLEAAIMLSMEEEATRRRGESGENSNEEQEDEEAANTDAARHAREGFPLARDRISRQFSGEGDDEMTNQVQSLMRGINRRRNRGSSSRGSGNGRSNDSTMDTASMLMRGITEEQQIAMAIAASLEQETTQTRTPSEGTSDRSGETSENEQESSSAAATAATATATATAALAETTEESASSEMSEAPAEETPATASVPSGNESSVTSMLENLSLPNLEVRDEETATSGQEDTCASAAYDLEIPNPPTVEETPTPSMEDTEDTEASADAVGAAAAAAFSKDVENTAIADGSTVPKDEDASERENSMFQA